MQELLSLLRSVVLVAVLIAGAWVLSFVAQPHTIIVTTDATAPKVLAPTTTPQVVATTTLAVATTTPKVVVKPKPTPPPATKPVTPKVEDLHITLNDAVQSITDLAGGATTTSVNDRVRNALVNIICTTASAGPFESISGSGVIIDPRGVILTNAHVAQFFLLHDYPVKDFVQCIIRTGSPATPHYTAELLFMPPSWIADNAHKIIEDNPTGNGEHDYALLRITGAVTPAVPLPTQFPFLLSALNSPPVGTDVLEAGYAAGFLGGITVQNNLYASSAFAKVTQVYTYGSETADIFSLGGSIVAQHGSSGGPVTTTDGTLIGVIVTATDGADTSARDLKALATSYIIRDFESERGKSLEDVLSNDLSAEADTFNRIFAPEEINQLETVLNSH